MQVASQMLPTSVVEHVVESVLQAQESPQELRVFGVQNGR